MFIESSLWDLPHQMQIIWLDMPVPELFNYMHCRTHGQKQAHPKHCQGPQLTHRLVELTESSKCCFVPTNSKPSLGDSLRYKWLPCGHLNPEEIHASFCYCGTTSFDSKNNPAHTPWSEPCMCQGLVGSVLKLYVKWLWCVFIWIIYINYIIDTYVPHPTCSLVTKTECLHNESRNQTTSLRQNSL